ncbi:MAG: bifunctional phosphopantothenoylcysteine decarboxylase/phosphopantothenate--cysteine ligase CoaBC [Polyangiaceae bacterium]|nr:bifunctional phosphopantothenoylcysteine decarboxylase/phosphopantothenate--cysteine ligase CoaBC [Polyangiaceae bacterium]
MSEPSEPARPLCGRRITLCVGGSIAAFKAASLASLLVKDGAEVQVVLTQAATEFINEATFSGLTGRPVLKNMFEPPAGAEVHIELGRASDLLVIAPATADLLARLATGRASDLVSTVALCARCPILCAPAMHPSMWSHPATQRNVATLRADGCVELVGPVEGVVASGESGVGRMVEPDVLAAMITARFAAKELLGRHVVVTAGPTAEDIDPVRYITNRSSGKMGFAIAERAAAHGARVTLIAGPVFLPTPRGVERIDIWSAEQMRDALWQAAGPDLAGADAIVMAAAVADFRPAAARAEKIRREGMADPLALDLVANPDIIGALGRARHGTRPVLVGFAMETGDDDELVASARRKLDAKHVDLVVGNRAEEAFARDDNRAILVGRTLLEPLARQSKHDLAERLVMWLVRQLGDPT